MEDTTIENTSSPSTKMEKTNADQQTVASNSNNQETDFKLMDSLHSKATGGNISKEELEQHAKYLDQILTPSGNTILHIHIISLQEPKKPDKKTNPKKKSEEETQQEATFVTQVLGLCPNLLLKANKKGETLLHFAARHGHGPIVKQLLEESKKDYYKDQEDGVETTRVLLGKINEAKDTALHEAVRYNHIDVVKKLIEADTDLAYDANESGETPLYLAAERGYTEVVKTILEKFKSPADDGPMGRTALHAAVIRRDRGMAKDKLLKRKESLSNKKDEQGRLPLHYAAYLGYEEIVDDLLEVNPSAAYQFDNDGKTALHLAAANGKEKAVDKLISKCPSCCELVDNISGRNALHFALTSENDPTVNLFLKNSALGNLINQKDNKGDTPLLQLANSGSFMRTFIRHDRVDKLAFNTQHRNAADIILAKDLIMDQQESFLMQLDMIKKNRYRRIIVAKEEVNKEGKSNRPSRLLELRRFYMKEKEDGSEDIIDKIKAAEEPHLVAATLIATVTFAAGFTLPGGYIGEDGPNEGAAILTRSAAFKAFVIFDTTAFVLSCLAVLIHLTMGLHKDKTQLYKQFKKELRCTFYAMIAMVFAFVTGVYAVLYPDKTLAITACVIGCVFGVPFSLTQPAEMAKDMMKKKKPPRTTFYMD